VCGLSEVIATFVPVSAFTRVDLPTFRAARDGDESGLHPSSHVSGSSSAGVVSRIAPSAPR